eukprot:scaffold3649_cov102-Skeletonema_dohrnii-CCMP3373.AAC.11
MESSQRKESGWDSQGRLFKPKQRRILCSSGINMINGQNDLEMLTDKRVQHHGFTFSMGVLHGDNGMRQTQDKDINWN